MRGKIVQIVFALGRQKTFSDVWFELCGFSKLAHLNCTSTNVGVHTQTHKIQNWNRVSIFWVAGGKEQVTGKILRMTMPMKTNTWRNKRRSAANKSCSHTSIQWSLLNSNQNKADICLGDWWGFSALAIYIYIYILWTRMLGSIVSPALSFTHTWREKICMKYPEMLKKQKWKKMFGVNDILNQNQFILKIVMSSVQHT